MKEPFRGSEGVKETSNMPRRRLVFLTMLAIAVVAAARWWMAYTSLANNLATKISAVRSGLRDVEEKISFFIEEGSPMPVEFLATPPILVEIPALTDKWVNTGNGTAYDWFSTDSAGPKRYRFVLLSSGEWFLLSNGPDGDSDIGRELIEKWSNAKNVEDKMMTFAYDPTNGVLSDGDIWRIGRAPFEASARRTEKKASPISIARP